MKKQKIVMIANFMKRQKQGLQVQLIFNTVLRTALNRLLCSDTAKEKDFLKMILRVKKNQYQKMSIPVTCLMILVVVVVDTLHMVAILKAQGGIKIVVVVEVGGLKMILI